jgi:hypothetical protein
MNEPARASAVWREALVIVLRHPVATVVPVLLLGDLLLAAPVVPVVAVASLAAIALPTAVASVLVMPDIWLMTRWSLFAPVIVGELLGPLAALRRSNELVRGHFEVAFLTPAFAVVLEEAVADAGASGGWRSQARRSRESGWGVRSPP